MKNSWLIGVIILLGASTGYSQNEGTLTFMNSLPQTNDNNPSAIPKYSFSFGLPASSVMAYYANNGFSYNDVISKQPDGTVNADLTKLNSKIKPKNYITQALAVDLLRLGLRVHKQFYLTLNAQAKTYNRLMLPKDLLGIFINGNAPVAGATGTTTLSMSPKAESLTYLQTSIGAAYSPTSALTFGARIKYLKGLENVTTQNSSFNLTTDNSTYALTATAGMDVRTSGIYNFTQSGYSFKLNDYLKNNGFALDLGATYKVTPKLTVAASIIDLGSINWKNNTYGYSLDPSKAKYNFQGVDLSQIIKSNNNYLQAQGDSIQKNFKVQQAPIGSYRTPIPAHMYVNGSYTLNRQLTLAAVLFSEIFKGRMSTGITVGANKHFGSILSLAGSYTVSNNSYNNIGAGVSLNLTPVQLFMVGDNLLRIPFSGGNLNTFANSTQFFNVRVGMNFVFGWDKKHDIKGDPTAEQFQTKNGKQAVSTGVSGGDFQTKKGKSIAKNTAKASDFKKKGRKKNKKKPQPKTDS